jgi:hypothetical protein
MGDQEDKYLQKSLERRPALDVALGPMPERRCLATSKSTGKPCAKKPIVGGFVCMKHGGAIPATREAARQRLRALVDPAIDALTRTISYAYTNGCEVCGGLDAKMMAVVVKASQLVLDRCGYGPTKTLEVKPAADEAPEGWEQYLTDEQLQQMTAWIHAAKETAIREGALAIPVEAVELPASESEDDAD